MALYACPLINAGGESTGGWVARVGGATGPDITETAAGGQHSGNQYIQAGDSVQNKWDQEVTLEAGLLTTIDGGAVVAHAYAWHRTDGTDDGNLYLEAYDSGHVLLASSANAQTKPTVWTQETLDLAIPANTRYIRIGTDNDRNNGTNNDNNWDDFELILEGDFDASMLYARAQQLGVYVWGTYPSDAAEARQVGVYTQAASETATGFYELYAHQLGVYCWCRPNGDRRELRAWRFKQDDNEFYGIQLGADGTLVYNQPTQQWAQWRSPGELFWRVEDVVDWEGFNLGCDTSTGIIWEIDPEGRLDYGDTPIESVVVGYLTHRMRTFAPCFMAELAISEGQPPPGFDDGSVGITLRTSTDDGNTYVDHGEVTGGGIGEDMTVRWYGLGLMKQPGMYFEITDTGYARRIDGLDIEIGGVAPNG